MKKTLLILSILSAIGLVFAQAISEGFESTTFPPTGWTNSTNGCVRTTNNPRTGVACLCFNGVNDAIYTPIISAPNQLSFWYKRSSTATAWTLKVQTSTDASNWSDIGSITNATAIYQEFTYDLSSLSNIYVRLLDQRGSGTNERYVDDFVVTASGANPPTLTADTSSNNVDNNIDISFTDDATWRAVITAVKIGGSALTVTTDYVISTGNIQLKPSGLNTLLTTSGSKSVTVEATGYNTASVTQIINAGAPTSNSTAAISAALALGSTRTVTCTAKDQYNNLVSGYTFKYDATVTDNSNTTDESYTISGSATTSSATDVSLSSATNSSGVATFTIVIPAVVDVSDGVSVQVQLADGTTNIGSAFSYIAPIPVPAAPTATADADPDVDSFTASWNSVDYATGYYLDVYTKTASVYASDLLFSEYIEGSSNNKAIEIFNGTASDIDLGNYTVYTYSNGVTSPSYTLALSGTLVQGDVYVIANANANATILSLADVTSAVTYFDGNDTVVLSKDTKAGPIDIFGCVGESPSGGTWGTDPLVTAEKTLVRKSSVTSGISTSTSGFPTLATEWESYPQNTTTYLGSHTMSGGITLTPVTGYNNLDVSNVISYLVTGLAPGTTYYYVVRAYNGSGTSGNSTEVNITTDEPLPVVLSSFTASISVQNNVMLTWVTQTETGMAGYYIYRSANNLLANAELVSPMIGATNTATQQVYTYTDSELYTSGDYYYWLESVDFDGNYGYHGPVSVLYDTSGEYYNPEVPLATELKAIYPNPFNPLAFIPFSLASTADVSIQIYNNRGQLLRDFDLGTKIPGEYRIEWNGTDRNGQALSTGVYYIRMNAGKDSFQRKAVLLK